MATGIAAVASIPGVYFKVLGMVTEADHVVEQFGLDLLMFSSDWPVCLLASSYGGVVAVALEAVGPISESDKAGLMGGNAAEFYRLEAA